MPPRIKVPGGMLKAASLAIDSEFGAPASALVVNRMRVALESALGWVSENPIVPTNEQIRDIFATRHYGVSCDDQRAYYAEWQRRMFLSSEPEMPEISDKVRADCNMACLLHLVGCVERGEIESARGYAEYVRSMLRLAKLAEKDRENA